MADHHFKTTLTLMRHLWPSDRRDLRVRVVVSVSCLFLGKIVSVLSPLLYKQLIDKLTLIAGQHVFPIMLVLGFGMMRLLQTLFNEARDYFFISVSQHAQRTIALRTFEHLHRLSLSFHLERQTGGLSRVIERGVHGISFFLSFLLFNIAPTILELILVTATLSWVMDPRYGLILFGTVLVYIVFTLALTEHRLKYRKTMNHEDTEANAKAIDSLINYETVKYFNNEDHEKTRFDESLERYERSAVVSQRSLSWLNIGQGTIVSIGNMVVLALAAYDVAEGRFSIGDFAMISLYMTQLFIPLNFLGFVYREMKQGLIDMSKMTELWDLSPEVADKDDAEDLFVTDGSVVFKNVSFHYNKDRPILQDISFTVAGGQTVALVGPSGAGKSTIARLLFRFYDPSSGQILIDGQDIRTLRQKSLHATIGVVPQDTVLFNDTIAYNIAYGRPGADKLDIRRAAERAKIGHFIDALKDGMETRVGERGLKLSGGEKQRVSIARTVLKDPPILIFDEATSALDTDTEREIQRELDSLRARKTTLVIAHRLSTVISADLILVLKDGVIVERGSHGELLAQRGLYSAMWDRQLREVEYRHKLAELIDTEAS